MSPEAQQIAIAKACGLTTTAFRYSLRRGAVFTFIGGYDTFKQANYYRQIYCGKPKVEGVTVSEVEAYTDAKLAPDYLNDRNAMAGALSTRHGDVVFWSDYKNQLLNIAGPKKSYTHHLNELLLNPSTADQAEAFLRALNLFTL